MTEAVATLAKGDGSRVVEPRRVVVRDESAWRALWAIHAGPSAQAPSVDFTTRMVGAVFAGERPTPGYEVIVSGARRQGTALALIVEERAPGSLAMSAQLLVTPFHIVSVPRHDGEVRFTAAGELDGAVQHGGETVGSGAAVPSSTGLEPNTAAALAYLAGPFSGVLVLLAERTNRFVLFHAYQALIVLGGLGLLAILLLAGAFAALLVSPSAFTMMYWLAFLTGLLWLALWAACLVQAFTGREWRLPIAGNIAARRAGRVGGF